MNKIEIDPKDFEMSYILLHLKALKNATINDIDMPPFQEYCKMISIFTEEESNELIQ